MTQKFGLGDTLFSDVGNGTVKAITDEFIIIETKDSGEQAVHMEQHHFWVPSETKEKGVMQEREVKIHDGTV